MVIIDENTFEEQFQLRFSGLTLIVFSTAFLLCVVVLVFLTIVLSPVKEYIPGYSSSEIRQVAIDNYLKTDSLINAYEENAQYLNAIKAVLMGDVDYGRANRSETPSKQNNFPETHPAISSDEDSFLRTIVEQEDKYNVVESLASNGRFSLFPPAKGPLSQTFNPEEQHYGIDIVLDEDAPVRSVAEGIVIFAEWTAQTGYVIIIEHPHGLLSVYKHNSELNKNQGDSVMSGEVIATAGNTGEFSTGWHLHFELWMDGYPINPSNFFDFDK